MTEALQIPAWLRSSNPPADSARPADKVAWVRRQIRSFTRFLALEELYQLGDYGVGEPRALSLEAAVGFAEAVGLSIDGAILAHQAEWSDATANARAYTDTLRKAVWVMGRDEATGPEIMARARAVNESQKSRFGIDLSSDDLLFVVRKIAFSAATGNRSHGRRR